MDNKSDGNFFEALSLQIDDLTYLVATLDDVLEEIDTIETAIDTIHKDVDNTKAQIELVVDKLKFLLKDEG